MQNGAPFIYLFLSLIYILSFIFQKIAADWGTALHLLLFLEAVRR